MTVGLCIGHPRFHLAIPVDDLSRCRQFYGSVLGLTEGRSDSNWVDFDLFGHQLVIHQSSGVAPSRENSVDGDSVPVPHFGVILDSETWHQFARRLVDAGITFVIEPRVRFQGEVGEQHTMFFLDPAGNALEFKSFAEDSLVFASNVRST